MQQRTGHRQLDELHRTGEFKLEGVTFILDEDPKAIELDAETRKGVWGTDIEPGDMYLAGRNGDLCVFTALEVHPDGFICAEGGGYPFDFPECAKVRVAA